MTDDRQPAARVLCGDVLETVSGMEPDSFDAIFCDPPYGLSFMGREWDHGVPSAEVWREVMRVLKPGGHLMAFGGTRTYHRLAVAIEDAGFEIRDSLMWLYGSGFPKSYNISKGLDKKAGAEREVIGVDEQKRKQQTASQSSVPYRGNGNSGEITAPATPAATLFDGYGTALKPAYEPIVLAMKPKAGTYADNALEYGVAGLNIDGGRIGTEQRHNASASNTSADVVNFMTKQNEKGGRDCIGRFPANLILDERAGELLDEQTGDEKSRFFYTAKASKAEREAGLSGEAKAPTFGDDGGTFKGLSNSKSKRVNTHPCVKPLDLCRYFCTMLLPPERDGARKILVPFSGSGSEMIGAMQAGWDDITGIEMEREYCELAERRLAHWKSELEIETTTPEPMELNWAQS